MPRIRTIKPEFWGDEKLAPCSITTRLVFLGLISMADDMGRVVDNIKVIDAFIFPETSETSRGSVDELSAMGRLRRGKTASGQRIIEIANWSAHQKVDKPNLRGSLPPIVSEVIDGQEVTAIRRHVDDTSPNVRRHVDDEPSNHTNDQRPTTDDLRPTSGSGAAAPAGLESRFELPHHVDAYLHYRHRATNFGAMDYEIQLHAEGGERPGVGIVASQGYDRVGEALHQIRAADRPLTPRTLHAFLAGLDPLPKRPGRQPATDRITAGRDVLAAALEQRMRDGTAILTSDPVPPHGL